MSLKTIILQTLLALTFGAAIAHAQDETVPLVQDVRTLQVRLETIGQEVTVKYAVDGNRIFYFPVFLLKEVKLPGDIPAVSPSGDLRLPSGTGFLNLTVRLLDLWKSRAYQDDLIATLTNHSVIRSLTPTPQLLPAATSGQRRATLFLIDPNLGNQRFVLAESLLSDLADAQHCVSAQFLLDEQARASLAGLAGGLPIQAQHLAVQVEEGYRARYTTTLALINLQSAVQSLAVMRQSLIPAPDRGQPTLLLSPNLPQPGTQAGSVVQDSSFTEQVRRFVRLQVLTRAGASVDPQLVDRLVSAALDQAALALQISDTERQNAVASILLEDGLSISMALSEINELDAGLHSSAESEYRSAFINAATKSQNTEVRGSAKVGIGFLGGRASAETKQNWSRSDYVNRRMEDIKRQVSDANVRLSGSVRVMTGIRFSQSGAVENVSFTSIEQSIGTFTLGDASILNTRSVQEYADLLNSAQQIEALLVPQVLVGNTEANHSWPWPVVRESNREREVGVTFEQPFATPPKVTVGISYLDTEDGHNVRVAASPKDISETGFTMVFGTWADSIVYECRAMWVAVGQARISASGGLGGLASIGTPGQPPVIPAEVRQAVLTPVLQSAPQVVEGSLLATYSAIPGRSYQVDTSTNLVDWNSLGAVTATDFHLPLDLGDISGDPHRFFRVSTP